MDNKKLLKMRMHVKYQNVFKTVTISTQTPNQFTKN